MTTVLLMTDDQIQKRIGEKIKHLRLKQNITQASLAEAAQLSLSTVKKLENGKIGSFDSLLRILRTLKNISYITPLIEEDQISPNEYYEFVNKQNRKLRKRAFGKASVLNSKKLEW